MHNGDKFDFRLVNAEMKTFTVQCADSIIEIRSDITLGFINLQSIISNIQENEYKEGLLRNKTFSRMSNKKMRLDDKMSFRQPDLHSYRPGLPPSVTHGAEAESD